MSLNSAIARRATPHVAIQRIVILNEVKDLRCFATLSMTNTEGLFHCVRDDV